jgi:hypothetical protein
MVTTITYYALAGFGLNTVEDITYSTGAIENEW